MTLRSLLFFALALTSPVLMSAAPPAHVASAYHVDIRNFHFLPARLTVPAGAQVTWTNRDEEPHIVVSAGGQFPSSPGLDTGDSYHATFSKPGTYAYFCSILRRWSAPSWCSDRCIAPACAAGSAQRALDPA